MFSNVRGLSTSEVSGLQKQYGSNKLPEKPPPSHIQLVLQQVKNPLVYVLLIASLVTIAIGHFSDAVVIFVAVFLNTVLGFIQERKATNALHALKHYVTSKVVVIRDGKRVSIDTPQLVPGDSVVLAQGVKVPADGKLVFINRLYVDESILTGESVSVEKKVGDEIFMGTTISSGQGLMLVETIGAKTKMGAIALQIQEKESDTPLQRQLRKFSKQLVVVVSIVIAIVFVVGILYRFSLVDMFTTSVALAVSSIPEGLIVSLTVVLAISMQKILKRKGLVRQLAATETLGGVTVICVDKTGTLTEGKMTVVDSIGNEKDIAEQALLANDLDDPLVISAFEWARGKISDFIPKHERLDSIPFSSKERFFTSLHRWTKDKNRIYVNGAPEHILSWTTLSEKEKKEISKVIDDLTGQGKRLIGFARKDVNTTKKRLAGEDAKTELTWVGILAFSDPVRPGVKEALDEATKAGIRTIVITGDYAKTSEFVMAELGIDVSSNEIVTGDQLRNIDPEEFVRKIKTIKLFARTTPDQKLAIVEALKKNGEIVAMTGDGVNDAPALHSADIGIAVGEATDVAKESADLVLLDSNFSTIVAAIEEGRGMFENIRKIILYLMCDAFAEIIVVTGSIIVGLPLPLRAIQILWVNLISDGFPNLALTIDPKRAGIMNEKPRPTDEKIINRWMSALIGFVSLTAGLITLTSFAFIYKASGDIVLARSVAFIMLGMNSLTYVFSVRTLMSPFWKNNIFENRWLVVTAVLGLGLQILPFAIIPLRNFFGIKPLSPVYWLSAFALSIFMFLVVELFKFFYQLRTTRLIKSGNIN